MYNPCTDKLSEYEYLLHMIPHHQVAIDMSELMIKHSNDPNILHTCRNIIRKQKYEIWEMNMMKSHGTQEEIYSKDQWKRDTIYTKASYYEPVKSKASHGACNPLFFDPEKHKHHYTHMKLTSISFLKHMIPHHQIAVDMSKRLLLHSNSSYFMDFAKRLIYDQEAEILFMNDLLNSLSIKSDLLNS